MILSHSFHFVKCGYAVFSPFFCGFCHLSHRPGTTSGVARKIGTGDAAARTNVCFFRFPGARAGDGWSPAFFRARSSPVPSLQTRPAGDRILPRTPVARFLFVGATTRRPHFFERARHPSPARLARTSPPSNNVQKRETPRRLPRNGFYSTSGFYRTFGLGFSRREPAPGDPLLRFRRYSAARTMRSGYTLLVRSVDPSGQIMSRTYPFSPNVTGISTVRVS